MPKPLNIAGQKFDRLTAISPRRTGGGAYGWLCKCDCGNDTVLRTSELTKGYVKSCGCLHSEKLAARRTSHGLKGSPEYKIWDGMKQRCANPNHKSYHRYGGRGIKVCDRWLDSFEAFLEDMGPRPMSGSQIERQDNDGNYKPGNCIWATRKRNANNRSSNRHIEFAGETKTLAQWAEQIGCSSTALHARLSRGWSVEDALTRPFARKFA